MAMAGLVMGILSITCGMCCCYGLPFNVLGIIFSLVALAQIKNDPHVAARPAPGHRGPGALALEHCPGVLFMLILGLALSTSDILRKIQRL